MFKFYVVPDATKLSSHSAIYSPSNMKLFWDPRSESDAYALLEAKGKAELNKAGSLEFSLLPTNVCYNEFHKRKSVVLAYDDDELIFEGVVTTSPKDFYKQRKVTCSGALVYLADSIQAPDEKNEVVVPEASDGIIYVKVPLVWYEESNPNSLEWYERKTNASGTFDYNISSDTTANPSKTYYYQVSSSGENVSGITITRKAATTESIGNHISRILDVHNAQVDPFKQIFPGQINDSDTSDHDFSSTGWRTSWDSFNSDILEAYGRYATVTTDDNGTLVLNYLDIWQMSNASPVIEYATNMLEMNEADDGATEIFTVLVPIGKDNLTISGVSGHDSGGSEEVDPYIASWGGSRRYVVVSKAAIARYGYIVKTQNFGDVEDASELYNRAIEYIYNNYDFHKEYDVKAIDLKVLGLSDHRITVGDMCRIKSTWHEVDERNLFVLSAEYDYINPENDSFKIGIPTADREAGNRRLSSQTKKNAKKSKDNASNYASGSSAMGSILDNYIHVTEWGLEMNSRLKNEVESADKKYTTRFVQDEYHINLAAEKLFGIDKDGRGDKDAGYVQVLPGEYRDGNGPYKNPVTEHWFEKKNDEYILSKDTTCDPSVVGDKTYYIQRLWSRYSDIDVGEGGIKARVDGNYETATYCSSWIQSNEESIIALTGHLYVDEEGHAHVTSGVGSRTDHQEEKTTEKYIPVPTTMYSQNPDPLDKVWYERVFDSSGAWVGQNKADSETNDSYYKRSHDRTVDRNKKYYYKSFIREEFVGEYGIFDEDNLTGGVVTRMINNPTYVKVDDQVVYQLANNAGNPSAQGWFEYNETTGTFGLTRDTAVARRSTDGRPLNKYYTVRNNYQSYSDVWGEHIVVGRTASYSGMSQAMKQKVDKYITDNKLDGTITEIASDVVVVNALLAKYIETDEIVVNTMLASDSGFFNRIFVGMKADSTVENGDIAAVGGIFDWLSGGHATLMSLTFETVGSHVGFGSKGGTDAASMVGRLANPDDILMGFGTITTTGDTVNIPFTTLLDYCSDTVNPDHKLSFDKPASLGAVTWSSGNNTLTVKTAGGKDFLVGRIANYTASNQSEAQQMANAGYLATETTGYSQVYGLYYTFKNAAGNDVQAKTMLFKTPKDRYEDGKTDGISEAKGKFGLYGPGAATASNQTEAIALSNATTLSYGSSYMVYKTYDGELIGNKTYFKTPSDRYNAGKNDGANSITIDPSSDVTLGYSESKTVTATTTKADGTTVTRSVKITAPADNSGSGDSSHSVSCDLTADKTHSYTEKGDEYTRIFTDVTFTNQKWYRFEVKCDCGDSTITKKYAIYIKTS